MALDPNKLHTELKKDDPPFVQIGEVLDQWCVERMISVGGFGQVFCGYHTETGRRVALKVESAFARVALLKTEAQCLQHINTCQGKSTSESVEPFLHFYAFGTTPTTKYLVMDLSGPNLGELKKATIQGRFSTCTSLWIMYKMIDSLRHLHHNGWIHRDIKPANFCIDYTTGRARLFILDFGMCRYFYNRDGSLKMKKEQCAFHGTVRYASLCAHRRQDLCRFDDLWSVYYITCENLMGALPWRLIADKDQVQHMKETINLLHCPYPEEGRPPGSLCGLFRRLLQNSQIHDGFYLTPDYDQILKEINNDLVQRGFMVGSPLDWEQPHVRMNPNFNFCPHQTRVVPQQPIFTPSPSVPHNNQYSPRMAVGDLGYNKGCPVTPIYQPQPVSQYVMSQFCGSVITNTNNTTMQSPQYNSQAKIHGVYDSPTVLPSTPMACMSTPVEYGNTYCSPQMQYSNAQVVYGGTPMMQTGGYYGDQSPQPHGLQQNGDGGLCYDENKENFQNQQKNLANQSRPALRMIGNQMAYPSATHQTMWPTANGEVFTSPTCARTLGS